VAARLPAELLAVEGLPVGEPFLSGSWAFAYEVPAAFAGGRRTTAALVRVDATTSEGLVDDAGKARMTELITAAFVELAGLEPQNVLVVIHTFPSLGMAGALITTGQVRAMAASAPGD
jgi:phenylpyruvate tautomerase PptA (4-oxalocrotonate tautomerase family)